MLQSIYSLQKVLYDEERGVEYSPLCCMNNDVYARSCVDPNAKQCIFAVNATAQLNSDIASNFRKNLVEGKIDFLVNYNIAKEDILNHNKDYINEIDENIQMQYEEPFLETQTTVTECAELQYEKMQSTGAIKIYEKGKNRKDHYSSASYGSYFIDLLEIDSVDTSSEYEYCTFVN